MQQTAVAGARPYLQHSRRPCYLQPLRFAPWFPRSLQVFARSTRAQEQFIWLYVKQSLTQAVSAVGSSAYAVWTDWRDTVAGTDPRETESEDGADVFQDRTFDEATQTWSGDQAPRAGGLDQNIYGTPIP
jgi:hypothetical protein